MSGAWVSGMASAGLQHMQQLTNEDACTNASPQLSCYKVVAAQEADAA